MTNYFTQVCVELPSMTDDELKWLRATAKKVARSFDDFAEGPDFDIERDPSGAVIIEGVEVTIDMVTQTIQRWLKRQKTKDAIAFSWACTADKMKPGAYGGGAAFVTAEKIETMHTSEWVNRKVINHAYEKKLLCVLAPTKVRAKRSRRTK